MKKKNNILLSIIIFTIMLIIVIIVLLIINLNKRNGDTNGYTKIEKVKLVDTLENVKIRNNFYAVKQCLDKYYLNYMTLYNIEEYYYEIKDKNILKENEQINAKVLYNMLDKEYIKNKDITSDNIKTKLGKIKNSSIDIVEMYVSYKINNIEVYLVKGRLIEKNTGSINTFQVIVKIDTMNTTFSILPKEYVDEKYNNLSIGNEINIEIIEKIEENKNNTFNYRYVDDETYIKDLFNKLRTEISYSLDLVYQNLDEEYKNEKFGTFEKFQKAIQKNNERYAKMQIGEYKKTKKDNNNAYICIDKNGNYYIFCEIAPMRYTLMLDTYTVDLPEFIEKYNSATNLEKVGYNIQKCIDAINNKDYSYVYKKLDDTFRSNNYSSEQVFENYIKNNLFESNVVDKDVSTKTQNDIYVYNIIIKNKNNDDEKKKMTVIMKLGENTDFTMSFSIK